MLRGKSGKLAHMTLNQSDSLIKTFQNKNVLITGHTGFKGVWLSTWLTELGAHVRGYSLSPQEPDNLFDTTNLEDDVDSVIGDIRDKQKFEKSVVDFQPDYIFHLAAQPLVRKSYEEPVETYEVNVIGTANLLNSLQKIDEKCICVFITTDKVYHNNEWYYPYRENDRLGGYDPYSSSKACCEILIDSFRNSFFNTKNMKQHQKAIATARAGNVIGGGDYSKDRLVPDIIRSLESNEPISIRNPLAIRPWQHVLEPLFGYLSLAMHLNHNQEKFASSWNFGPSAEDNLTVQNFAEKAIKFWGSGQYVSPTQVEAPHEAGLLTLDSSKSQKELNWFPKYTSSQAIEKTINWYKNFSLNKNPKELIKADISSYTSLK